MKLTEQEATDLKKAIKQSGFKPAYIARLSWPWLNPKCQSNRLYKICSWQIKKQDERLMDVLKHLKIKS